MRRGIQCALVLLAALSLGFAACQEDGGDDDESGPSDDDADDDATDDDEGDDDEADPYAGMAPRGKPVGNLLGISSHMSKSADPSDDRDFEIEKLAAAGVNLVRTDFSWSRIEPADDEWYFDGYDAMVDACGESGLDVCAILDFDVEWAAPDGIDDLIDPAVWADFNGAVAAHFADRIDLYEIWNEENTTRFWQPEPNPEGYGDLLRASYEAIHANDPDATVVFGGLSPLDSHILSPDGVWNFLIRVHDAHPDLCDIIDGMAIHPYTFIQQTSPERVVDLVILRYPNLVESIDQVRGLLDEIGCPDKPIHLTEMGWPSLLIGDERQGAFLARGVMLAASREIDSFCWYTFWDGSGDASLPTEDYFGLFAWPRDERIPKPSYEALVALNDTLGGSRYAGDVGVALGWEEGRYALAFADDQGAWTIGLWHDDRDLTRSIPVEVPLHPDAAGEWTLLSQTGESVATGDVVEGAVRMNLLGWAHYLRFETAADR